jgi:hypothetical protein
VPKNQTNSFGIGPVEITCTSLPGVSGGPGQFRMILSAKQQATSSKQQAPSLTSFKQPDISRIIKENKK